MHPNVPHVDVIRAQAQTRDDGQAAVIATTSSGVIVYWNDRATALYGWHPDQTLGRNVLDVTPTYSSADEAARIMERLAAGEAWTGSFLVQRRDGERIVAFVTDVPVLENGQVVGIIGISHDERRASLRDARD